MGDSERIVIPSEPIGSIPRSDELLAAEARHRRGGVGCEYLHDYSLRAIQSTIKQLEATGSTVITDGEQTKPSFLTYPIAKLMNEQYIVTQDCFSLKSTDGRYRRLPRLIKGPFRYATHADEYMNVAKQFTNLPIKQAVISPSALTMLYPIANVAHYSHEQFLNDLAKESEKDIRLCLESGAHCVQIDLIEACFSFKIDPSGQLLRDFIRFNNRVLNRFIFSEQHRLGVHVCLGISKDCDHFSELSYTQILPLIFDLHVGNFYLPFSCEQNRVQLLSCIRRHIHPWNRVFIGVIDPHDPRIETPEEVCERVLEAAKYIPIEQLGTTDDCGFAPYGDDQSLSRQRAFAKIRARIQGTHMAEEQLMSKKSKPSK